MKARLCSLLLLLVAGTFAPAATLDEWIAKGCSSPDREWRGRDYTFYRDLLVEKTLPLPRWDAEPGRTVLRRLTSPENLSLCLNRNLPPEMRAVELLKLMDGGKGILTLYAQAATSGAKVEKETADLQVFILAVADAGVQVVEEFIPTIPKDEKYESRMAGFAKVKSGLTTIVEGGITSLSERTFYSDESIAKMAAGIRAHYPRFASLLPSTSQAEFRTRVDTMLADEKNPKVKDELKLLHEALKAEPAGTKTNNPPTLSKTNSPAPQTAPAK